MTLQRSVLVLCLLLASCTSGGRVAVEQSPQTFETPSPSPSPSPAPPAPPAFSLDRAMEHARVLSSEVGPRPAGSSGETRAATYIEDVFRAAGYEVERQEVRRLDGGVSYNILARRPGAIPADGYVLVGGHYDTVAGSPGGNDNASGTGVVLALAEAFAMHKVAVEFVAFAAEELQPTRDHHVGSRAYVSQLGEARMIVAMISIDMVGNGPSLLIVRQRGHTDALQNEIASVAARLAVPHSLITRGDISDHSPFAHHGVPAAFLWSGSHPTHHRPSDVFDVVQRDSVDRAGRVALEWLLRRFPNISA